MASEFFAKIIEYSDKIFAQFFTRFIVAIIILLIGFIIGRLLGKLTQKALHEVELNKILKKANIKIRLEEILSNFVTYFIYFVTIVMVLQHIGIATTILNMIAGAVILIIILSTFLGVKDFIPNAIAGIMIQSKKMIQIGEIIKVKGMQGEIHPSTLRSGI